MAIPKGSSFSVLAVIVFIAVTALFCVTAYASSVKHFQMSDGLISDTVTCVTSDKNNNIWVGTVDGIARFDGAKWDKLTVENGCLKDNSIWAAAVDETKDSLKIWFGTGFGLAVFENNNWTHYVGPHEDPKTKKRVEGNCPIDSNVINKIFVIKNNKSDKNDIFIVAGGKLFKFNGSKWSTFDFSKDILKTTNITCIYARNGDVIWLGTSGQGVIEFNVSTMKITAYTKKEGLPSDYITAIHVTVDGKVWAGTESGLCVIESGNFTTYNYRNSKLVSDYITSIQSGIFENVVISTDKGINMHDGKNFVPLPNMLSVLNGKVIWAMDFSSTPSSSYSQLWIGTRGFGLYLYQVSKDMKENIQEDQTRIGMQLFNEKKYQQSVNAWDEILKIEPENKEAMVYKSKCFIALNKLEEARKTLIDMLEKNPENKEVILTLAELYLKDDKLSEANKTYEKLITQFPKEVDGYLLSAQTLYRLGNFDDSISNYTRALAINSELPSLYKGLAKCFVAKGNFQKALDISSQLQYKKPEDTENNINVAKIYAHLHKYDNAEDELKKILNVEENNFEAKSVLGHVYLEKGNFKDAEKTLLEAVGGNFKDAAAHAYLSLVHIENNKIREAKESIGNARLSNPYEVVLTYAEGRLFELEGKFEEAINSYKIAMSSGYNNANVHYRLATSLKSLERYDDALKEYNQVLAIDPAFKKADDVKWMISKLSMPTEEDLTVSGASSGTSGQSGQAGASGQPSSASSTTTTTTTTTTRPTLDELDF